MLQKLNKYKQGKELVTLAKLLPPLYYLFRNMSLRQKYVKRKSLDMSLKYTLLFLSCEVNHG